MVNFDNQEYLRYKHFDIDVCLIRGTTADEFGNISMEQEVAPLDALSQAMATKKRGGIVICQVMRLPAEAALINCLLKFQAYWLIMLF
jgi:propionate CoA-transferase